MKTNPMMKKFMKGNFNFPYGHKRDSKELPYFFMNNLSMQKQFQQGTKKTLKKGQIQANDSTKEADSLSLKSSEFEKQKTVRRTKIPPLLEYLTEVNIPLDLVDKKLYFEICKKAIVNSFF